MLFRTPALLSHSRDGECISHSLERDRDGEGLIFVVLVACLKSTDFVGRVTLGIYLAQAVIDLAVQLLESGTAEPFGNLHVLVISAIDAGFADQLERNIENDVLIGVGNFPIAIRAGELAKDKIS